MTDLHISESNQNPFLDYVNCRIDTHDANGEPTHQIFHLPTGVNPARVEKQGNTFILPSNMAATFQELALQQDCRCTLMCFNFSREISIGEWEVTGTLQDLINQHVISFG